VFPSGLACQKGNVAHRRSSSIRLAATPACGQEIERQGRRAPVSSLCRRHDALDSACSVCRCYHCVWQCAGPGGHQERGREKRRSQDTFAISAIYRRRSTVSMVFPCFGRRLIAGGNSAEIPSSMQTSSTFLDQPESNQISQVRLTYDRPSQAGWIFSRLPLTATNFEVRQTACYEY